MRKRIVTPTRHSTTQPDDDWLDLDRLAVVEVTSEDPSHPIEAALLAGRTSGWQASEAGTQVIRLVFDQAQPLRRIWLHFVERRAERTQAVLLRWSPDGGKTYHDIVRQQWNFSPNGATSEVEDHRVELAAVTVLELNIDPDIGGKVAMASLEALRLA